MKKVLFCLSLIFGLLVLNQVPSFAMEYTFESIGGLGDLGYGLIGGASFDFGGTEYVIEDYDNLSEALKAQAAEQKAREFLQAYCMARGIPIPNIDPDLPATNTKDFYKSQYFDSANRTVWNNYKLGRTSIEQQDALRFPISPQAFNDWTGYSEFWYKKYSEQFNVDVESPVNPNPLYQSYLDTFNGYGQGQFFWYDLPSSVYGYRGSKAISTYPASNYSWFKYPQNTVNVFPNSYSTNMMYCTGILTLNITFENNLYTGVISQGLNTTFNANTIWYDGSYPMDGIHLNYDPANDSFYMASGVNAGVSNVSCTYSNSDLGNVLSYFNGCFRNINVYVDGEAWALVGVQAPANPTIPSFPDVIGGNDEDPLPAYDIVFPNTSDYEGTFDITSLFDALKEAIIGASDSDDSTDSTLTRERVTDTYKDKVGEAVGEAVKTIDDVMEDSFPLQGTLNYPNLPPIPQIPLDNAFSGTTILSELIDACQQILPDPLVLAFWGMIFILFIIGLIRILHK